MTYRRLGQTPMQLSTIGFGAWAIGGSWGEVDDAVSLRALHAAVDAGVNFIDTADVYGMGRSERLVAQLKRERPGEQIWVATKAGRKLPEQTLAGYSREHLTGWVDESLRNLETEQLDLLQLHCPHPDVYDSAEVFGILDDLTSAGKLAHYGVSVETVDEGLRALAWPNVQSIQVIFNVFHMKPLETLLPAAQRRGVGIIARVPLASGLLTGKLTAASTFAADDHRQFNRHGESFDRGETFSGVPYDVGLAAVEALRPLVSDDVTMAQFALQWILSWQEQPGAVTTAIPGARTPDQARANAAAGSLPPLDAVTLAAAQDVYDEYIREHVHANW